MVDSCAISIEGLGKRYRLGAVGGSRGEAGAEVWALRDVSVRVAAGEVLGVIGGNGSGKSTLLKILSRVVSPTTGRAVLRGRVGSLLEVGTGFHPELTGRENIYLNGAILGLRRGEIRRRFDEIVAFAEIDRYLDTPVKRYSSGMYVRLAFAVAAHLEPEILLIDEVLAVGDVAFQRRCLNKMGEVGRGGRTIMFVSHNMTAIRRLCQNAVLLERGRAAAWGPAGEVVRTYLERDAAVECCAEMDLSAWRNRYGDGRARILRARLLDSRERPLTEARRGEPLMVEFQFESSADGPLHLAGLCSSEDGVRVLHVAHHDSPGFSVGAVHGRATARFRIDALPLTSGRYTWTLGVHSEMQETLDVVNDVLPFAVVDMHASPRPYTTTSAVAYVAPPSVWALTREPAEPAPVEAEEFADVVDVR